MATICVPDGKEGFKFLTVNDGTPMFMELVDHLYSEIKICLAHNKENTVNWIIPVHPMCGDLIPASAMLAQNIYLMDTGKKFGEIEVTAITQSYWTCKCKKNFVHHKIMATCSECGLTSARDTERLPYINKIIKWELVIPSEEL